MASIVESPRESASSRSRAAADEMWFVPVDPAADGHGGQVGIPIDTDGDGIPDSITFATGAEAPLQAIDGSAPVGMTTDSLDLLDVIGSATGFGANLTGGAPADGTADHRNLAAWAVSMRAELDRRAVGDDAAASPAEAVATRALLDQLAAGQRDFGLDHLPTAATSRIPAGPGLVGRIVLADRVRSHAPRTLVRPFMLPLESTSVRGAVDGMIADVSVVQRYHNPGSVPIEATYAFPLPDRAGVRDFVMTIGDRRIRGVVREREEAERLYERAVAAGHTASLMRQERPNLFTQRVGNIPPRATIDVALAYVDEPALEDGWLELVVPMAASPRYRPSDASSAPSSAAPRPVAMPSTGHRHQAIAAPGSGSVDVAIDVRASSGIVDVVSGHAGVVARRTGPDTASFASTGAIAADRDLRLRWRVATDAPRTLVASHWDGAEGWFAAHLVPPALDASILGLTVPRPRSLVLMLDVSGSMKGAKFEVMRLATAAILDSLGPEDRFELVAFSNAPQPFQGRLVAATPERLRAAGRWLVHLAADGGTEMDAALRRAEAITDGAATDRDVSIIVLSDALNDAETDLVKRAADLHRVRLHAVGIGDAPNRFLVDRLAVAGGGHATVLPITGDTGAAARRFAERLAAPILTNLRVVDESGTTPAIVPLRTGSLLPGRPLAIIGRYALPGRTRLWIEGDGPGGRTRIPVELDLGGAADVPAVRVAWARATIAALEHDRAIADSRTERTRAADRVLDVALEHGLASSRTSFIAVDAARTTGVPPAFSVLQRAPAGRDMPDMARPAGAAVAGDGGLGGVDWWTHSDG